MRPRNHRRREIVTSHVKYIPWTDGYSMGYRIEGLNNDYVEYLYFTPDDDGPGVGPSVNVYRGKVGDPQQDESICYFDVLFEGLDYGGYVEEAFRADHDKDPQSSRIDYPQNWGGVEPFKLPKMPKDSVPNPQDPPETVD
jgi:hypothetical protein